MIIVTGASGHIGRELIRLLSNAGAATRAVSRHTAQRDLPGVEWIEADLADRDSLPAVFEGAERLFLLTGNSEDMVWLQKNAIAAARTAGVEHVVKLSALGATDHSRSLIGLWHYNVERVLRDSGLKWTVLRPHHFMQNLLDPVVFDRVHRRIHSTAGDGRIPFIDTRDIAAVAFAVLTQDDHAGRIHTLTGSEALSYADATKVVSAALGLPVDHVSESEDEAWHRLRMAGQPMWRIAAQLAIASYQRTGGATEATTPAVADITGRTPRTLREFAVDHVELLRWP